MIRCFKCGTPALHHPDGTVQRGCDCYQPSLLYNYPPLIHYTNATTTPFSPIDESAKDMKYHICPLCGGPVVAAGFHRCRGIGSVPESELLQAKPATPPEPRDPHDSVQASHLDNMAQRLEEHERTCESCSYFKQHERITRCVEYRNLQQMQTFWKKRVEAQK